MSILVWRLEYSDGTGPAFLNDRRRPYTPPLRCWGPTPCCDTLLCRRWEEALDPALDMYFGCRSLFRFAIWFDWAEIAHDRSEVLRVRAFATSTYRIGTHQIVFHRASARVLSCTAAYQFWDLDLHPVTAAINGNDLDTYSDGNPDDPERNSTLRQLVAVCSKMERDTWGT